MAIACALSALEESLIDPEYFALSHPEYFSWHSIVTHPHAVGSLGTQKSSPRARSQRASHDGRFAHANN